MHARTGALSALSLPRHAASAAADLAAAPRAPDDTVLSIEGARTYADGIKMGAVAVFRAFRRAQLPWCGGWRGRLDSALFRSFLVICLFAFVKA